MSETACQDLSSWFHKVLQTTEELDYTDALDWFGLEFKTPESPKAGSPAKAWIGFLSKSVEGRLVISQIPRATPAEAAGLSVDDEILAVDDWRVTADGWAQRLEQYAPRDNAELLVSRREKVIRIPVTLGEEPHKVWQLQVNPKSTDEQKLHVKAWLSGS